MPTVLHDLFFGLAALSMTAAIFFALAQLPLKNGAEKNASTICLYCLIGAFVFMLLSKVV